MIRKVKSLRPSGTIFPAGHFYSPYPDLKDIENRRDTIFDRSNREVPGIDLREEDQVALVERIATQYYDEFPYHSSAANENRFRLDNGAFSYCDAVMLYAMLRILKPDRVIEIGSGNSSALMLDINEEFLGSKVKLTFIEPYPRLLESLMTVEDQGIATLVDKPLHAVGMEVFGTLESGDLLFVDSTHVSKAGSDVNEIFFEILPSLKSGTYIHIHDVFSRSSIRRSGSGKPVAGMRITWSGRFSRTIRTMRLSSSIIFWDSTTNLRLRG